MLLVGLLSVSIVNLIKLFVWQHTLRFEKAHLDRPIILTLPKTYQPWQPMGAVFSVTCYPENQYELLSLVM